jgi:hypothetical protein
MAEDFSRPGPYGVATAARVDLVTSVNTTYEDAFQFDPPAVPGQPPPPYYPGGATGPTWTFLNQNFRMDLKTNINASGPSLTLTSSDGQIVVDDVINRILHFNVPESAISLVPGTYIYDFIMYDGSIPPIRVMLMQGKFYLQPGVTGG